MECKLADKKCVPCEGGTPPLTGASLNELADQLDDGWNVVDEHHLQREFDFKNFREALAFTNQVGEIAEQEGHHPDIELGYGRVAISLHTHKIDGLSESDFVMAAKIDRIAAGAPA